MNRLRTWLNQVFNPEETNLKEGALADILQALDSPAIRNRWVENLLQEIWETNIKLDRLMEDEKDTEWKRISMRRNAIVFCLNEILTSRDQLESEMIEQERQDRIFEQYKGASAPLDSRR